MNRFFIDALSLINSFLAVVIIGICALAGLSAPMLRSSQPMGLVLGILIGIAIAALVCGTLAFFALMERHLRTIAEGAQRSAGQPIGRDAGSNSQRREPLL